MLCDALGREVRRESLAQAETAVSLAGVGEGLYFYEVESDGAVLKSGKLLLLH